MSIIFGIRKAEGDSVQEHQLLGLAAATDRWAPDGAFVQAKGRIGMGFQPYHTHQRANSELQPVIDDIGNMIVFDGRLDNHKQLCESLGMRGQDASDSVIALAAFSRWGFDCFAKFIGDWAVAIWSQPGRTLCLARDHAGTRTLYFKQSGHCILWSTFLETFFYDEPHPSLDPTYIARYLSCHSVRNLTPYEGIEAVPAGHYLAISETSRSTCVHWEITPKQIISCNSDTEYEEQFFSLFLQAVARREAADCPMVAELSGGMDSGSIVCMSDYLRFSQGCASENLIDTLSYYEDSEPSWDEMPYFSAVEANRGKSGLHISASLLEPGYGEPDAAYLWPGTHGATSEQERGLEERIGQRRYRVVLSGIGGDELTGGVPTPYPELADLVVAGRGVEFLNRSVTWSLAMRRNFFRTTADTVIFIMRLYGRPGDLHNRTPPWATQNLVTACSTPRDNHIATQLWRQLSPSDRSSRNAWWSILETIALLPNNAIARRERRYPFLDRDLVEFLLSVPRKQLVRPGQRRSLMRRSLQRIVPQKVLERRRKGFRIRGFLTSLQEHESEIRELLTKSQIADSGLIDIGKLRSSFDLILKGANTEWTHALQRVISTELWLRASSRLERKISAPSVSSYSLLQHRRSKEYSC